MHISEFDYRLPERLIAQHPAERRDESRLMVVHRENRRVEHRIFSDIVEYLNPGDCLVLNNTRVIPARLIGRREATGGRMEIFLLKKLWESDGACVWATLAKPGRRARPGTRVVFGGPGKTSLVGEVLRVNSDGTRVVKFDSSEDFEERLKELGQVPIPPYMKRAVSMDEDSDRYQTVYAEVDGAVAAPTAGLHFTEALLERIRDKGVSTVFVTLHVGLGTFAPVRVENIEQHEMHEEVFEISDDAAEMINETREREGRIFTAGTTSVRVLETVTDGDGMVHPESGTTDIFIYPGYWFKATDALITNFHLPRSTLLMLVCAFAGRDLVFWAYQEAIGKGYRFYSYGDAMLVL